MISEIAPQESEFISRSTQQSLFLKEQESQEKRMN
jgi:hypothetical protein